MADGIVDKRTPKDRIVGLIKTLIDNGSNPYMLRTRKVQGISSAAAYQTKMIVELLPQLTPQEMDEISQMSYVNRRGNKVDFQKFMDKFQSLAGEAKGKADVKSIASAGNKDQYAILIAAIKTKIEDFLLEQEQKIATDITEARKHIQDRYKSMDRKAFEEYYGEKVYMRKGGYGSPIDPNDFYYSMSKFYASRLGVLLQLSDARLPEFILKAQKAYRTKEYSKVDGLVYKLKTKYPNLSNFVMTNYRKGVDGIEFTLTADSPEGKVSILTQTIYAGGYNIQRLHLRWLMHVSDALGHKVKITQN
jgi:hypothetical protein